MPNRSPGKPVRLGSDRRRRRITGACGGGSARVTAATPKKPRYTDAGCSGRRATSALTNRRRHGRSYPGARVRWAALRGSGILPAPNQLLSTVRGERFEKASRSAGSIEPRHIATTEDPIPSISDLCTTMGRQPNAGPSYY